MPFRFRRSFGPKGMKVNLSKSGISTTMGVRGAHVTSGPRGVSVSAGIPGSGLSYTKRLNSGGDTGGSAASEAISQIDQAISAQSSLTTYSVIGSITFFLTAAVFALFEASFGCVSVWAVIGAALLFVAIGATNKQAQLREQRAAAEGEQAQELEAENEQQARRDGLSRSLDQVDLRDLATTVLALTGVYEQVEDRFNQINESTIYLRATDNGKVTHSIFVIKQIDPIGIAALRDIYKITVDDRCRNVYVFASAEFTRQAAEFAREKDISLISRERIIQLAMEDRLHW